MPRRWNYPSEYYPYHSRYEPSFEDDKPRGLFLGDDGSGPYGGPDAYERFGSMSVPRSDYFGRGYEPFGVMDPFINGADDGAMMHHSARHGYGIGRNDEPFDIAPRAEQWLRSGNGFGGFGHDYRFPMGEEFEWAREVQYPSSESPYRIGPQENAVPWHSARFYDVPEEWGERPRLEPAYGGEFGILDFGAGRTGEYHSMDAGEMGPAWAGDFGTLDFGSGGQHGGEYNDLPPMWYFGAGRH